VRVRFQLRPDASDEERRTVLEAVDARRLFPNDDDPELARLYVAEIADASALAELQSARAVDFVEAEPPRRLSDG
jgi:hypothetical protein